MKKLKVFIIILIILILLVIGVLIFVKLQEKKTIENDANEGDAGQEILIDTTKTEKVTDKSRFFSVRNCVQQYLDEVNNNNDKYFGFNENNEYTKTVDEQTINENRLSLLSTKFIEDNNITTNNLNDYIETFDEKVIFDALQMRYIRGEEVENYIVYGIISSLNNEYLGDMYIVVNVDRNERTFSIEPLSSSLSYDSIDEIQLEYDGTEIQPNDRNAYTNKTMSYEDTSKEYFSIFKRIILVKPDLLYDYLQEDYKLQRFGTLDDFEKYVESNKEEIAGLQIQKYLTNNYEDYTEFVCMDQYQNLYIFDETNPMEFTLELDSYTIITDNFKTTYDESNNEYKVAMNIDKWIQMLNARDYKSAYNCLDETFRNNNFGSEEAFEQYMRENFPLHYEVEFGETTENNGIYQQEIILTDITGASSDQINKTIIMQLGENYEFVMSFNME